MVTASHCHSSMLNDPFQVKHIRSHRIADLVVIWEHKQIRNKNKLYFQDL